MHSYCLHRSNAWVCLRVCGCRINEKKHKTPEERAVIKEWLKNARVVPNATDVHYRLYKHKKDWFVKVIPCCSSCAAFWGDSDVNHLKTHMCTQTICAHRRLRGLTDTWCLLSSCPSCFVRAPACFALIAFVPPVRHSMLWTREGTRVCLYSFGAHADPVHISVCHTDTERAEWCVCLCVCVCVCMPCSHSLQVKVVMERFDIVAGIRDDEDKPEVPDAIAHMVEDKGTCECATVAHHNP